MDYFRMLCEKDQEKTALVVDGISYSYGELVKQAALLGEKWGTRAERVVRVIKERDILSQLLSFLACFVVGEIPLLVPFDQRGFENGEYLTEIAIPDNACMAVATSGTTGASKIYFRSYESWTGYFEIQNEIFQVTEDSRLFAQGSIAFTGNLNLYMAQFYAGGTVVAENLFQPRRWAERIREEKVSLIYLIPSKLMLLTSLGCEVNRQIRMILSGSQSLGREDVGRLKEIFPDTRVLLYYGASELNYITYVMDGEMQEAKNLIGKPFPQVNVEVKDGELFVSTKYHVEGVTCPYSLADRGCQDEDGNFYFLGRNDDILNVRGRKVSAFHIESVLLRMPEIKEAAVAVERLGRDGEGLPVAYVVPCQAEKEFPRGEVWQRLRQSLEQYEMPRRLCLVPDLPKNESGKVDKRRLGVLQ